MDELLGGRLKTPDLEVGEALPVRFVDLEVFDILMRVTCEERSLAVNPASGSLGRVECSAAGVRGKPFSGTLGLLLLNPGEKGFGEAPGPLVAFVAPGGFVEVGQEPLQVTELGAVRI